MLYKITAWKQAKNRHLFGVLVVQLFSFLTSYQSVPSETIQVVYAHLAKV